MASQEDPTCLLEVISPDSARLGDRFITFAGETVRICVRLTQAGQVEHDPLVGQVNILLLCPGTRVLPLSRSLPMPPDPEAVAEFTVVTDNPGTRWMDIVVIETVRRRTLHRQRLHFVTMQGLVESPVAGT